MNTDIIIQLFEKEITSGETVEIKEALDKDYKYLVGIAIADGVCSDSAIIEIAKIKGLEFLPPDFEAVNIIASKNVDPNMRFFTLFNMVKISGDDLVIHFIDSAFADSYNLKIQVLLTNNPEGIKDALNN